jgi:hypothetical protein
LAESGPKYVHVPCRVGRADVGQQGGGVAFALGGELLAGRDHPGQLGGVGWFVVGGEEGVELRAVLAGQRRLAGAGAARVEAHEVKPGQHRGGELLAGAERVLHAGPARPAGVDDQRADPVGRVGGGQLDHRQGEPRPVRFGVIEGHD